jgi:hypothetical protein
MITRNLARAAVITAFGLIASAAWADRELVRIDLSGGCPAQISDDEPRDDGQCGGDNACRGRGDNVRWEIVGAPAEQFSLSFSNPSIFANWDQGLCRATSGNADRIQCRISPDAAVGAESSYSVSTSSCPPIDPKIIVNR